MPARPPYRERHDATRNRPASAVPRIAPGARPCRRLALYLLLAGTVAGVVLAVHWPVLSAQALCFDDSQFLVDNPLVRNPSIASARRLFAEVLEPSTVQGYYLPLSMTSLMLDYALGGRPDDLTAFHRTSLALHAANTVLVVVLLGTLFQRLWPAVLAGLLFGIHPLTVEPVAWIGERKTLLAAFFALWCLVAYARFVSVGRWRWLVVTWAAYALATLSKPTAVPLPLVLLLLDYWPLRRLSRGAVVEKIPLFLVGGVMATITTISHSRTAGLMLPEALSGLQVPLLICHNIVFYLQKIVWPLGLSPAYAPPEPMSLSNPAVLAAVIGTCALAIILLCSLRRTRALLTGFLVFVVVILPTLGLLQYSWVTASDKYVYLPAVGFLLILTWALVRIWDPAGPERRSTRRRAALLLAAVVLAAMETGATRHHLRHWRDTETLARHMIHLVPQLPVPHYHLGHTLHMRNHPTEAAKEYREAIRLHPSYPEAHNNLGLLLHEQGHVEEAVKHFSAALGFESRYLPAHVNLVNGLRTLGQHEQAVAACRRALHTSPTYARLHNALGVALAEAGKMQEAESAYRAALRLDPARADACANLGLLLLEKGETQQAINVYRQALALAPRDAHAHNNLGVALQHMGLTDEAAACYEEALRLRPDFAAAHANLASLLVQAGDIEEGIRRYEVALRADPDRAETFNALGDVLFGTGDFDRAAEAYASAVRIDPAYHAARRNLGVALAALGQPALAVPEYRAVLEVEPDSPFLHNNLGAALLELGQTDQAIDEFRRALDLKPDYAAAHGNLADALTSQDRLDEAVEHYRTALRLDPGDTKSRTQLDGILSRRRQQTPD